MSRFQPEVIWNIRLPMTRCAKAKALLETIAVSKVIIGWSCDRELYEHVIRFLKQHGIECYLWLPVFSETGILKADTGKLIDDTGNEVKSYCLSEGENFEFYCPEQQCNIRAFLEIYEENFEGLGFDGVFLDKIRYGSFSNGLGGVFSCFVRHAGSGTGSMGLMWMS